MADKNKIWDSEEMIEDDGLECADNEDIPADEGDEAEAGGSVISGYIDSYCDNLINPDPEKCISPKVLYITLGASALGAVVIFLFIGWLLCYCPLKTSGYSAEEFIAEYNAIVSEADVTALIEDNLAGMAVSGSDLNVLYPDFTDLTIPEDADLEDGVLLCGGDILLKADLRGGNIQSLEVAVTEDCEEYNFDTGYFSVNEDADADYSKFQHYAAVGKARLALHKLVCNANGTETDEYVLNAAINYGVVMENYAYYVYSFYGTYDPSMTYYEDSDTFYMAFDPSCFRFYADTLQKTVIDPDNGIYRFFDSIFGEKPESEDAGVADTSADNDATVASATDAAASASDVSAADAAVSSADAQ